MRGKLNICRAWGSAGQWILHRISDWHGWLAMTCQRESKEKDMNNMNVFRATKLALPVRSCYRTLPLFYFISRVSGLTLSRTYRHRLVFKHSTDASVCIVLAWKKFCCYLIGLNVSQFYSIWQHGNSPELKFAQTSIAIFFPIFSSFLMNFYT